MRSSHTWERGSVAALIAFGIGLALAPTASADPDGADPMPAPGPAAVSGTVAADAPDPATAACGQFAEALDVSAAYYGDYADDLETTGRTDPWDANLRSSNTRGRTALREAAAAALNASATPGLQPDIADPMRAWSMRATKLLVVMGLRVGGDTLNTTAIGLNNDATEAQMACARAGTQA